MTDTVHLCKEEGLDHIEQLLHGLLKVADDRTLASTKAIVDCLVHNVLTIDEQCQRK